MHILVVVAITKVKTFWTEVEKGSTPTVFECGLFGPKSRAKVLTLVFKTKYSKGILVNILIIHEAYFRVATQGMLGDALKRRDKN